MNKYRITRRESLKYITLAGISSGIIACTPNTSIESHENHTAELTGKGYHNLSEEDLALLEQTFFTPEERETVRILGNLIIPRDERSGNAEDANVTEFIEFMMLDQPRWQVRMRGGIAWLNNFSLKKFNLNFTSCSESQQKEILDIISFPDTAPPEVSQGVSFFNMIRNFVATGFFTSKMGIEDLQYMGNVANNWDGAPQEWLDRLGVSYED